MTKKITLTEKQRSEIETLGAVLTVQQTADYFGINKRTFERMLHDDENLMSDYKKGKSKVLSKVGTSLIRKALDGDLTSQIFYLKTQGGWRETVRKEVNQKTELSVNVSDLSNEQLQDIVDGKG